MEPKLGELIVDNERRRDAIHIAIAPVVATETLQSGQRIKLADPASMEKVCKADSVAESIGIVDPYLEADVQPGDRFWMFLKPGTVTSLRHIWSHPAFEEVARRVRHEKG